VGEIPVSSSGTRKTFYSGYNESSRQFLFQTCIVPKFALKSDNSVDPRFLVPDLYLDTKATTEAESTLEANGMKVLEFSGDQNAEQSFMKDASASTLMDRVGGGLDVNISLAGGNSVQGGAQVAMQSGSSDRSTNLAYYAKLKAKSIQVQSGSEANAWALTDYGRQVKKEFDLLKTKDDKLALLSAKCGTHFLSQVEFGAAFFASLKISAKYESDKDIISGKLKAKLTNGSGNADLCIQKEELASSVKVEMRAFQQGGSPSAFVKMLSFKSPGSAAEAKPETPSEGAGTPTAVEGAATDSARGNCGKPENLDNAIKTQAARTYADSLVNCSIENFNDCMRSFEAVMAYATGRPFDGKATEGTVDETGAKNALFTKSFGEQLDDRNNAGYTVIGYRVRPYSVYNYMSAGFIFPGLNDTDTAPAPGSVVTPPAGSVGEAIGRGERDESTFQPDANGQQDPADILPDALRDSMDGYRAAISNIINLYSYFKEVETLVSGFQNMLDMNDLTSKLDSRLTRIRSVFSKCRSTPSICQQAVDAFEKERAAEVPLSNYLAKAEEIVRNSLKDRDFEGYCKLTGAAQFRDVGRNRWRLAMYALADKSGLNNKLIGSAAGNEGTPADSILTWRIPTDAVLESKKVDKDAYRAADTKSIADFCAALAVKVAGASILNLEDVIPAGENQASYIEGYSYEPLTFMPGLRSLTINNLGAKADMNKGLVLLPQLESLTIKNAKMTQPEFLLANKFLGVLELEDWTGDEGDSASTYALLNTVIRHPNLKSFSMIEGQRNRLLGVTVDLGIFPDVYKAPEVTKKMAKLYFDTYSDDSSNSINFVNLERFFGYKADLNASTCSEAEPIQPILTRLGAFGGGLNTMKTPFDTMFPMNPCCRNVMKRCAQVKALIKNKASLVCSDESYCL
jgi:hypothetical protein